MEFGRVDEQLLDSIDFSLPAEPPLNNKVLTGNAVKDVNVYVGCTSWGRKEWVGKIYPNRTSEKDFLQQYVHHFNSVELNATHYKVYNETILRKWAEKVKSQTVDTTGSKSVFKFCPKMYQGITHQGSLYGKEDLQQAFLKALVAFGEYLGPVFIQLSDSFSPTRKQELFDYLYTLPKEFSFFVELRHPDWFGKDEIRNELFATFKQLNIGAVITDTAGRRDCAHMHVTVPKVFIRFVGNSLHQSDYTRCNAWVQQMKRWQQQGMEEIYFFLHMPNEATVPELAAYLVDCMNQEMGLNLMKPKFMNTNFSQTSLF
jgi:uncharacterized protein YecE (DUF72 family)